MIDVQLTKDLDLQFNDSGDLKHWDDIDTSIILALSSDKGLNWMLTDKEGSSLYLLAQSKLTNLLLIDLKTYIRDALAFLLSDGWVNNIKVDIKVGGDGLLAIITLTKIKGTIHTLTYNL